LSAGGIHTAAQKILAGLQQFKYHTFHAQGARMIE
jgi:hypothetical protein